MIELETYEKLILHRNFRSALQGNLASSFDPDHMQLIHEKLCRGLEHRDGSLKSGELRVGKGAAKLLGTEANTMAPYIMASMDKHYVAQRAAYVMSRIENMQPFHSFNSMVGKLYSHNLVQTSGFNINWPNMDKDSLSKAINSSKQGNNANLVKQIESNLSPMYEPGEKTSMADRIDVDFKDRAADYRSQKQGCSTIQGMKVKM